MAYLNLAVQSIGSSFQEALAAIAKAVEYSASATDKEKLYIEGVNAMFVQNEQLALESMEKIIKRYPDEKDALHNMGSLLRRLEEWDRAIESYKKILVLDPMDKLAYNQLAYSYQDAGDIDRAIAALDKYIELAPGEANPYDSRGDLYAYSGRLDEAIESYRQAIAVKPDFVTSIAKLGHMYLYQLDEDRARAQYRELATSEVPSVRSTGRYHLANIFFYRGRMKEGIEQMDAGAAADEMEGFRDFTYVVKILAISGAYTALEKFEGALVELRRTEPVFDAMLPPDVAEYQYMRQVGKAYAFAVNKQLPQAKEILAELAPVIDDVSSKDVRKDFLLAQGQIAFEESDYGLACDYFEKAEEINSEFQERYSLGVAYLEAGRHEESIKVLERIVNRYDTARISYPGWSAKVHFQLGRAYEGSGDHRKAVEQYERFLSIWQDGDPELREISEAKARLEALRVSG